MEAEEVEEGGVGSLYIMEVREGLLEMKFEQCPKGGEGIG